MINLPDVTLVTIDTACYDLARMAIEDSCQKLKFARVIVFTDRPDFFNVDETIKVEVKSIDEAMKILWYKVPDYIRTSHALIIQWDGWVINHHLWDNNWLEYDYIGAPWTYEDGLNVGNGGFSLRSKRLMSLVATDSNFQYKHPEDYYICRIYRRELEAYGLKWPEVAVAERFSFENPEHFRFNWPPTETFGFHAYKNWPLLLTKKDLEIRTDLIKNSGEMYKGAYYLDEIVKSGVGLELMRDVPSLPKG